MRLPTPSPGSTPRRRCATKRFCSSRRRAISPNLSVISHNALLLCTQLLLEDYIKWRPALFRAFCAALADAEPQVRPHHDLARYRHLQRAPPAALPVIPVLSPPFAALTSAPPHLQMRALAHTCLFQLLLPRAPLLAFNSFLGLLFQLNGCNQHPTHSATLAAAESQALEPLRGEGLQARWLARHASLATLRPALTLATALCLLLKPHTLQAQRRRLLVLRPLLSGMSGEHKLQTMAKLCQAPNLDPYPLR